MSRRIVRPSFENALRDHETFHLESMREWISKNGFKDSPWNVWVRIAWSQSERARLLHLIRDQMIETRALPLDLSGMNVPELLNDPQSGRWLLAVAHPKNVEFMILTCLFKSLKDRTSSTLYEWTNILTQIVLGSHVHYTKETVAHLVLLAIVTSHMECIDALVDPSRINVAVQLDKQRIVTPVWLAASLGNDEGLNILFEGCAQELVENAVYEFKATLPSSELCINAFQIAARSAHRDCCGCILRRSSPQKAVFNVLIVLSKERKIDERLVGLFQETVKESVFGTYQPNGFDSVMDVLVQHWPYWCIVNAIESVKSGSWNGSVFRSVWERVLPFVTAQDVTPLLTMSFFDTTIFAPCFLTFALELHKKYPTSSAEWDKARDRYRRCHPNESMI